MANPNHDTRGRFSAGGDGGTAHQSGVRDALNRSVIVDRSAKLAPRPGGAPQLQHSLPGPLPAGGIRPVRAKQYASPFTAGHVIAGQKQSATAERIAMGRAVDRRAGKKNIYHG
jgi:hypothetical protein